MTTSFANHFGTAELTEHCLDWVWRRLETEIQVYRTPSPQKLFQNRPFLETQARKLASGNRTCQGVSLWHSASAPKWPAQLWFCTPVYSTCEI